MSRRSGLREIQTLFLREVRHMLRDRHTMIYTVAIPIFFYPLTIFVVLQSIAVIQGAKERQVSRILFEDSGNQPFMRRLLENDPEIRLLPPRGSVERSGYRDLLLAKEVDAVLTLKESQRGEGGESLALPALAAEIHYSSVRDASMMARARLESSLSSLRDSLLTLEAQNFDAGDRFFEVLAIEQRDLASGERKANFVLSLILPLLMVVILVMGAFYPALDTTAGERERGTLETTLLAPVSRNSIVIAKYIAVCTMAMLAFALNFASMTFSLKHVLVQIDVQSFRIPWSSIAIILLAAMALAAFIAAMLLSFAFRARSFKEGQSYMSPVYLIAVLPVALTFSPDVTLTPTLAIVPIVNLTLVFREVLQDRFDWPLILQSLLLSFGYSLIAIYISAKVVSDEKFLLGENVRWRRKIARKLQKNV